MKKYPGWFLLLVSLVFSLAVFTLPAAAANKNAWSSGKTAQNVSYLDANGEEQICPEARVLEDGEQSDANSFKYYDINEGWYVVYGKAYFYAGWSVHGDVHLILADGCQLTIDSNDAGIYVRGAASITIYGQSTGKNNAKLLAYGKDGAGIGGEDGEDGENITINGGTITAQAKENSCSAGIGGGEGGAGINITINGGFVTALGNKGGAGIGGGANSYGKRITINGGEVHATGGGESAVLYDGGAGIGGGDGSYGESIYINGGSVYAKGGDGSAGIGGGSEGNGGDINISGGYVEADGGLDDGTYGGAGIGGGDEGNGSVIYIHGTAYVVARGEDGAAGIGGGDSEGSGSGITISGGRVHAYGGAQGAGIGGGYKGSGCYITIKGGFIRAVGNDASSIGSGHGGSIHHIYLSDTTAITPDGSAVCKGRGIKISVDCSFFAGNRSVRVYPSDDVRNIEYMIPGGTEAKKVTAVRITEDEDILMGGWYFADGSVENNHSLVTEANTNIILCDGCDLKIHGESERAGINVTDDMYLTIYGQSEGTGTLSVWGGDYAAGIGGNNQEDCGNIIIYGGVIQAYGDLGAGIGGGFNGDCRSVYLMGGTVHASGTGAYGIGPGSSDFTPSVFLGGNMLATNNDGSEYIHWNAGAGELQVFLKKHQELTVSSETLYPTLYWMYKNPDSDSDEYEILKTAVLKRGTEFTEDMLPTPEGLTGYWCYNWVADPTGEVLVGDKLGESDYSFPTDSEVRIYFIGHSSSIEYVTLYRHYDEETILEDEIIKGESMNLNSLAKIPGMKIYGWYYDEEFENLAYSDSVITEDTHLYRKARMNQLRFASNENTDGSVASAISKISFIPILVGTGVLILVLIGAIVIAKRKKVGK